MMVRGIINEASLAGRITIWAWDSKGGNDARRKIFPNYKNRPPQPGDKYAALLMIKELLKFTPAWQVELAGYEGDDIVAALANYFRGQAPIRIITRDGDLTQLVGQGVTCTATAPVPPHEIVLYKTCVGDPSDTIPGIKGFGKDSWAKADKTKLQWLINQIILHNPWFDEEAAEAGLSKGSLNWLRGNEDQVRAMNQIVQPLPISNEQLQGAITRGTPNPAAIEACLQRFLQ